MLRSAASGQLAASQADTLLCILLATIFLVATAAAFRHDLLTCAA
jgi:hypothetical protein